MVHAANVLSSSSDEFSTKANISGAAMPVLCECHFGQFNQAWTGGGDGLPCPVSRAQSRVTTNIVRILVCCLICAQQLAVSPYMFASS